MCANWCIFQGKFFLFWPILYNLGDYSNVMYDMVVDFFLTLQAFSFHHGGLRNHQNML